VVISLADLFVYKAAPTAATAATTVLIAVIQSVNAGAAIHSSFYVVLSPIMRSTFDNKRVPNDVHMQHSKRMFAEVGNDR
jgi:hypothetical protein